MAGEMPSQSLPGLRVGLHQALALDLMSLALVSFLFPLHPPYSSPPLCPFQQTSSLPSFLLSSPFAWEQGSSPPTMGLLACYLF